MEDPGKICFRPFHTIGKQLLIFHGDNFDEIMPKSRLFMKAFKLMHNVRVKLGATPVHVAHYAKKWKLFYKVLRNNVMMNAVKCAKENNYKAITCGHTHFSEDVVFDGTRYINTGTWTETPISYLVVTDEEMTLKTEDT
jgi:UDP-2,3-diacylglucosamine pyrophosphatase LpxH